MTRPASSSTTTPQIAPFEGARPRIESIRELSDCAPAEGAHRERSIAAMMVGTGKRIARDYFFLVGFFSGAAFVGVVDRSGAAAVVDFPSGAFESVSTPPSFGERSSPI